MTKSSFNLCSLSKKSATQVGLIATSEPKMKDIFFNNICKQTTILAIIDDHTNKSNYPTFSSVTTFELYKAGRLHFLKGPLTTIIVNVVQIKESNHDGAASIILTIQVIA